MTLLSVALFGAVAVFAGCGDFVYGRHCNGYAQTTWETSSYQECQGHCANKNANGCCGATNHYTRCAWYGNNGMSQTRLLEGSAQCTPSSNPYKCHTWTARNKRSFSRWHGGRSKQDVCRLDANGFYEGRNNANFPGCSANCECCTITSHAKWEAHALRTSLEERVLLEHGVSEKDVCHASGRAWTNGINGYGFGGCGDAKCCQLKGKTYRKPDISKYKYSYHCAKETTAGACRGAGGVWSGGGLNAYRYPGCMECKCCKKGFKWDSKLSYRQKCVSSSITGGSAIGNLKDLVSGRCCGYDEGCMPQYKCRKHGSYTCSAYPGSSIMAAASEVNALVETAFGL